MNPHDVATTLTAVGLAAVGSVAWLLYFRLKDRISPEPKRRIAQAFGLGMVAAGVAWLGYWGAAKAGFPPSPPEDPGALIAYCMFVVGVVEEGAKFLVARFVCFRWKEFDERIDGLVYATAVALGFAAVENVLFLRALPWPHGLLRVLVSPLTHSLFAAVWGFGTARALLVSPTRLGRFLWQALPLAIAMALHGLYDIAVLVEHWTPVAAGVVAMLWAFVIWNAQRLAKRRPPPDETSKPV
jgi:RsiW-degrading membrane proteinase PrsW (M82 family)